MIVVIKGDQRHQAQYVYCIYLVMTIDRNLGNSCPLLPGAKNPNRSELCKDVLKAFLATQ
jgi:hypothetical protein